MSDTTSSFPYRLAAVDLDGTLLGPHKEISPENLAAMHALQARGVRIVLASGRRHQNSVRFYRQAGLDGLLMSCAGALLKDPDTGEVVRERTLDPADAARLVAEGQQAGYTVVYYHREHLYTSERSRWTELYESRVNERTESLPEGLESLGGKGALKVVWYGEPQKIQAGRAGVEAAYKGRVNVVATDPENLEFLAVEANKADALAAAAKYYHVEEGATLAFGDGENDAPMLRWAALGVAVDGANAAAKAAADLVGNDGAPETRFARAVEAVFQHVNAS